MIENALRAILVALVWSDALTTYLFLRKAKEYGYPSWCKEETSPVYRHFIKRYGLTQGIAIVALINPLVFIILTRLAYNMLSAIVSHELSLGLGYGVFYGMILISVHRNYFVYYKSPASRYNEKVLGKPRKNE